MTEKKYKWHMVAASLGEVEFAANNIAVVDMDGKNICLGKFNDALFAFAYKCPHAGGMLAEGFIDALGNIVCPLHRYKSVSLIHISEPTRLLSISYAVF